MEIYSKASKWSLQVGIDLIGPLPVSDCGKKYIVTMIDYFSKWPEATALPDKTAKGVAQFIYRTCCRWVWKVWFSIF